MIAAADTVPVHKRIRELIDRAGMSQSAVARRMEVSPAWLNNRLRGRTVVQADEVPHIARALGVGLTDLFVSTRAPGKIS